MMKTKRCNGGLDPEDSLCCCEYIDRQGARTHIAACCCDCEDLDEVFDRWLKKESQSPESLSRVLATISDRLRVPWIFGARQVDLTLIPPLVLLPVFLHIAALHYLLAVVVLTIMPISVLWYYFFTHRKKGRTLFFLSLALFSLFYMFFLFIVLVVPRGDVSRLQLSAVTVGVSLTVIFLVITKRGPGYVRPCLSDTHSIVTYHTPTPDVDSACLSGAGRQDVIASPAAEVKKGNWINSCVGLANHRSFLLMLLFFLLTSLYGISLVLRSVCLHQSVFTALFYCPGVYSQYSDAVTFTCAWYSALVTGGLMHLLFSQIFNISLNLTEREVRKAHREHKSLGVRARGFWDNWAQFLTMSETSELLNPKQSSNLV
ncbi:hypothetical protein DNTS_032911 [Danionella cerebrum]|uniref:Palmitoyltransferase n=1 Tax=Danionella cerebrum TaxID=2873325 RepID=A0A553MTC7_9TELE|nr:hypothetical protein DNTS_032911 [Danionella translucida]